MQRSHAFGIVCHLGLPIHLLSSVLFTFSQKSKLERWMINIRGCSCAAEECSTPTRLFQLEYLALAFSTIQELSWRLLCKRWYLVWLWSTFEHFDVIGLPPTTSQDSTSHHHPSVVTWEQLGLLQCWMLVESGRRLTAVRGLVLGGGGGSGSTPPPEPQSRSWGCGRGCGE